MYVPFTLSPVSFLKPNFYLRNGELESAPDALLCCPHGSSHARPFRLHCPASLRAHKVDRLWRHRVRYRRQLLVVPRRRMGHQRSGQRPLGTWMEKGRLSTFICFRVGLMIFRSFSRGIFMIELAREIIRLFIILSKSPSRQ
jgi:hypothetical protein